jgi:hypothetical protein
MHMMLPQLLYTVLSMLLCSNAGTCVNLQNVVTFMSCSLENDKLALPSLHNATYAAASLGYRQ